MAVVVIIVLLGVIFAATSKLYLTQFQHSQIQQSDRTTTLYLEEWQTLVLVSRRGAVQLGWTQASWQ